MFVISFLGLYLLKNTSGVRERVIDSESTELILNSVTCMC